MFILVLIQESVMEVLEEGSETRDLTEVLDGVVVQ